MRALKLFHSRVRFSRTSVSSFLELGKDCDEKTHESTDYDGTEVSMRRFPISRTCLETLPRAPVKPQLLCKRMYCRKFRQNLGAADPYMIFPLTTGVTTLLLAELGGDGMAMATSSTNMRAGMRAMSLVIIPLTMKIPVGVFVYWTTSNLFSVSQTILLKVCIALMLM